MSFFSLKQAAAAVLIGVGAALAPLAALAQQKPAPAAQSAERNARNIQQDLGKGNVEVEIVAYGPGLGMLKADSKVADRLARALDNNVGLMACENTMRNAKVKHDDMYGGISYVDAGVVHIMKRQREGWSYLRP